MLTDPRQPRLDGTSRAVAVRAALRLELVQEVHGEGLVALAALAALAPRLRARWEFFLGHGGEIMWNLAQEWWQNDDKWWKDILKPFKTVNTHETNNHNIPRPRSFSPRAPAPLAAAHHRHVGACVTRRSNPWRDHEGPGTALAALVPWAMVTKNQRMGKGHPHIPKWY